MSGCVIQDMRFGLGLCLSGWEGNRVRFVLLKGYWSDVLVWCLTFGVILLYIIISYTILFSSSDLSSLLPFQSSSSQPFLPQSISSLLSLSSPSSNPHSKYTCRELVILIYIPDSSSLCLFMFDRVGCFDPACFIGVDGWGVWCVFVSGWFWAGVLVWR